VTCKSCGSANQSNLKGELTISPTSLKNLRTSPVLLFPKLLVCMNCGNTEFIIPKGELGVLGKLQRLDKHL
jgi:hypothetical protein